jgi:hypothetical protein
MKTAVVNYLGSPSKKIRIMWNDCMLFFSNIEHFFTMCIAGISFFPGCQRRLYWIFPTVVVIFHLIPQHIWEAGYQTVLNSSHARILRNCSWSGAVFMYVYDRCICWSFVQHGIKYDHRSLMGVSCNAHFVNCVYKAFCTFLKYNYFGFVFVIRIV